MPPTSPAPLRSVDEPTAAMSRTLNWADHQIRRLQAHVKPTFVEPRLFVLLAQLAWIEWQQAHGENAGQPVVSSAQLAHLCRSRQPDIARLITKTLQPAAAAGLLHCEQRALLDGGTAGASPKAKAERGTRRASPLAAEPEHVYWSLTRQGQRYLMEGIKAREALSRLCQWNAEQICAHLSADEFDAWVACLPTGVSSRFAPISQRTPAKAEVQSARSRRAARSKGNAVQRMLMGDFTGVEGVRVQAAEERTIERARLAQQSSAGGLWGGLLARA